MRRSAGIAGMVFLVVLSVGCDHERPAQAAPAGGQPIVMFSPAAESVTSAPPAATAPASRSSLFPTTAASDRPASSPAATRPDEPTVALFTPLTDAATGEKVSYVDLDGRTLHYEIVEVDAAQVTTRVSLLDPAGRPLGQPAMRYDRRDADLLARRAARTKATRAARRVQIEAAGRRWDAVLYEDRWIDEEVHYVRRSWVSERVPVFGLIRMELTGDGTMEARLELRDMARASGPKMNR